MKLNIRTLTAAGVIACLSALSPAVNAETFKVTISAAHGPQLPWIGMIKNFMIPEIDKRLAAGGKHNIVWNEAFGGTLAKVPPKASFQTMLCLPPAASRLSISGIMKFLIIPIHGSWGP